MTNSIFDTDIDAFDDLVYIYDKALTKRARDMRAKLIESGAVYPLEARPTLRLRALDERHVTRHIHEGAWTIGLDEEDLPGFVAEEVHP